MKRILLSGALALPLLVPAAREARAQDRGTLVIPDYSSSEVMLLRISATSRCAQGCTVRAAPYSGERVSESVQVLADGNRIVQRRSEQLYRDGDGRTRVESDWMGRPLVQIQDPVQGMSYRLYPREQTGIRMAMRTPPPAGSGNASGMALAGNGVSAGAAKVAGQLAPALDDAGGQRSVRQLGTRQIEGVTAEGRLETVTVPAGKAGNALPIVSSTETWTSRELKLDLYVKAVDPRYGEQVTRVQNLRRNEPPAGLFAVPAEFTIKEIVSK